MKTQNITISAKETLSLISNLSTMIVAGIPILSAVDSLKEDSKGNIAKILEVIRMDLLQGKQLYVSFAKFPKVFNKITINMIRAAEEAGTLDIALKDLKEQIKRDMELGAKIRGALMYPMLVMVVFFGIMLVILTVVMPKISQVFSQLKVNLPLPTKILIFTSHMLLTYTIFIVLGFALLVLGAVLFYRAKKHLFLSFFFSLPIVSFLVRQIDLMRFSRSMYLLLTSGITITNALTLCEEVVMRKDIAKGIVLAKETVLGGRPISQAFKKHKKIFPVIMVRLLEAGEKTGTLDKSMQEIAEYFDYEVSEALKTLITVLEPIMLVFVGIVVGGMMLAIIAPIYNLIGQISPR